jgi:hypothetical protein
MSKLTSTIVSIIFSGMCVLCTFAGEIVLQNGLNGYSGCVDTWILRYAKEGLIMQEYMPDRIEVYADTCLS